MRDVQQWFDGYSGDHQNPTNRGIHWICVPVILWCVIAVLWAIPVPAAFSRPGLWAGLAMFLAWVFYWRLSRPLGLAMLALFVVFGFIAHLAYAALGPRHLLVLAGALFVAAWIGQFVGHRIEGRRPSFLTDLAYLLIGPAWLMGKLMRRAHIAY